MKAYQNLCRASLAASTVLSAPFAALAQDNTDNTRSFFLEEIMVTSQKREQSLSDVGIAVTAFSGDQLRQLGFENSTDLAAITPGVFISSDTGGQNRKFTIRGVTQNDFADIIEAPVAIYIDDSYLAPQQGQIFGLFDLERTEILRGPQGTLFGRNATGGLVHYISRKPDFDGLSGFVDAQYGSYDQVRIEGAVNAPVAENAAIRVSGLVDRNDAYLENEFPRGYVGLDPNPDPDERADLNGGDVWAFRVHGRYAPDNGADILVSAYGSRGRMSSGGFESRPAVAVLNENGGQIDTIYASPTETREAIGPGGVGLPILFLDGEVPGFTEDAMRPVPGGDLFGFIDPDPADRVTSLDFAVEDLNVSEAYGVTANISWPLGDTMTLTSITDYKTFDRNLFTETTGSSVSQLVFQSDSETETFAQEIRLNGQADRFTWVTGGYLLIIDNETDTGTFHNSDSILAFFPPPFGLDLDPTDMVPGPGVDLVTELTLETESYSLFGHGEYDITDTLSFTLGGRIVFESKDYSFAQNTYVNENERAVDTGTLGVPVSPLVEDGFSDTLWAGKAQLDYRPRDGLLIYAGINRGVKSGSINGPLISGPPFARENLEYGPEVLRSYEAGLKADILDGMGRFNASIFYYDYQDYQAFTFQNLAGIITNEDAEYYGGEIELSLNPLEGLDLFFSASYIDATVKDLEIAPGVLRNVEPSYTPDLQLAGFIRYGVPAFGGTLSGQFDASYVSDHFFNLRNFSANRIEGYFIGNVNVTWVNEEQTLEARFFVSNVTNETNTIDAFDTADLNGNINLAYGRPRWYGGAVRFSF